MNPKKLRSGEIISIVGGAVLAFALLALNWFKTAEGSNGRINGEAGGFTGFEAFSILQWVLLAASIAPLVLAYIIIRDHALSWPRGEMTAVIGIAALGLIVYNGLIAKPGEPSGQISLQIGWFVALLGALMITYGAAARSGETERRRKPPGVL